MASARDVALVKVFFNQASSTFVLVPFAYKSGPDGGSVASGPLTKMGRDEFLTRGDSEIAEMVRSYYTRDPSVRSELYQSMAPEDRVTFLASHMASSVFINRNMTEADIFYGPDLRRRERILLPIGGAGLARRLAGILMA